MISLHNSTLVSVGTCVKIVGEVVPDDLLPLGDHHLARPDEESRSSESLVLPFGSLAVVRLVFLRLSLAARTASTVCQE
jgi:hypothetical protein